jgi:hypothetical protein
MIFNRSYSSVFIKERGWSHCNQIPRVNSVNLANNCSKKLETLTGSARADRPDRGPSDSRIGPSGCLFWRPTSGLLIIYLFSSTIYLFNFALLTHLNIQIWHPRPKYRPSALPPWTWQCPHLLPLHAPRANKMSLYSGWRQLCAGVSNGSMCKISLLRKGGLFTWLPVVFK